MALWTAISCENVASLVTWGGVSDATLTYEERVDMRRMLKRVVGGSPSKYPDRYDERTPLFQIERLTCPVLIIHGTNDEHVQISHAYKLLAALEAAGKKVESKFAENLPHHFPTKENQQTVQMLSEWMKLQQ